MWEVIVRDLMDVGSDKNVATEGGRAAENDRFTDTNNVS
jgi:hypothetical protein